MTEKIAIIIFQVSWAFLLIIAVSAQILFEDKPKRQAGFVINLLVITPFVIALVWFYLRNYFGTFETTVATRIIGIVLLVLGMIGYISSHFYLQKNWSLSASIKEGHRLIKKGPYRFVRHPMYSSMLLVVLGSGLLIANYLIIIFTPIVGIAYYIRARKEEALLREEFPEYEQYARGTKMLIPCIL
jgi:protein-S-isoprenylcysteine O-methyltransferase Ste14